MQAFDWLFVLGRISRRVCAGPTTPKYVKN